MEQQQSAGTPVEISIKLGSGVLPHFTARIQICVIKKLISKLDDKLEYKLATMFMRRAFSTTVVASSWKNCGNCRFYKEGMCLVNNKKAIENRMDINDCGGEAKHFNEIDKTYFYKIEKIHDQLCGLWCVYSSGALGLNVFTRDYLIETIEIGVGVVIITYMLSDKAKFYYLKYEMDNVV